MITNLTMTLILLQLVLGAADTLIHHEMSERLAWRLSQRNELRLHSLRNLLYIGFLLMLGFADPYGLWAWGFLILLLVELGITLADFVEEDRSRALPASERLLHTVMTLNYGAILAVLIPWLVTAGQDPTILVARFDGVFSLILAAGALGVALFGVRDWLAAERLDRLAAQSSPPLLPPAQPKHILITGGTGFIGQALVPALIRAGHDVTLLTRSPAKAARLGTPLKTISDLRQLPDDAKVDAIVNLAGAPVAGGVWTRAYRHRLLRSRLKTTCGLIRLIARLDRKPDVMINASAVGIYGENPEPVAGEWQAPVPDGSFAQKLCMAWETEADRVRDYGVRCICLRLGLVLDWRGGVLGQMLPAFDLGLGGPMGHGRQWMSWIGRDDVVRLIGFGLRHMVLDGPVNATAPNPVRYRDFAEALARALGRPCLFAVPGWLIRWGLGPMGRELLLASQQVMPEKALQAGFRFRQPDLESVLRPLSKRQDQKLVQLRPAE